MIDRSELPIRYITINGLRTAEAVGGEGPPVLLLHGWGAEIALVWPLAQRLIPLGYRVYAPDLPGFGETTEPPQPWSVYDYAQFVVTYMDYHSLGRAHMFGHSFGGRLGLILGAEHPDRLISMALADAAGLRKPPPLTARARLRLYKGVRDGLKAAGLGSLSDRLRGWYNHRYGSSDFNATTGIMRETFVQVVNEDLRDHARRVAVPVLLIWGDADADTPLWQAQELERLIPDAGLMTYPGAGHYSYLEHPVQTARAMHALFKG